MARSKHYRNAFLNICRNWLQDWTLSQKIALAYSVLIIGLLTLAYLANVFTILPHDPQDMALDAVMLPPFHKGYLLGTDYLGRDELTRLIMGTNAYFIPGLMAVIIAVAFGSILGCISIYSSLTSKTLINIFNNTIHSMPRLVMFFLFIAIFEPNIYLIMLIVGISHIPSIARIINTRIMSLREKSFIDSAIASGLSRTNILLKQILWFNCRGIILSQASLVMSEAILMETSLSYLGFGVQEPAASWGNMIQSGASYLLQGKFWSSTIPAIAVMLTLSAFFLLSHLLIQKMDNAR